MAGILEMLKTHCSIVILVFMFAVFFPVILCGATINVPVDYATIQEAVEIAEDGDEIIVSPGIYTENPELRGVSIILRSTDPDDEDIVKQTVIDGGGTGSVITFDGDEPSTSALSGFTIRSGSGDSGGGIDGNGCETLISKNRIIENRARSSGGGIFNCHGKIFGNLISGNASDNYGGGVAYAPGIVTGNIIRNNVAVQAGGLFQCYGYVHANLIHENRGDETGGGMQDCSALIADNIIYDNISGGAGGGLYNCSGTILNNTVARNEAAIGGGLARCQGFIVNNIIWNNTAATHSTLYGCANPIYCCVEGVEEENGNISF